MSRPKYLGVIPARGGSKGVPRKNLRLLGGKPLLAWTIEAAKKSQLMDRFVVSTEDREIADVARAWGAAVMDRPGELATDTATTLSVLQDILKRTDAENIVILQPTSPIREEGLIDRCIREFEAAGATNAGTGFICKFMEYGSYTARRQDLNGFFYDDGNVYVVSSKLIRWNKLHGDRPARVEISREQNLEIDDELDFTLNESILAGRANSLPPVRVGGREIGPGKPCFVIAEAGVNHNGDLRRAKQLIDAAAAAGADAVKFQTFRTEELATEAAPKAAYQKKNAPKDSQFQMLKKLELSAEDFAALAAHCRKKKILFLSTPFDVPSARLLKKMNLPAYKIGSGELTNVPLLREVASYGKPVILSTGMATMPEVGAAVETVRAAGCRDLILLHCTSNYPTRPEDVNLRAMDALRSAFQVPVGFSDHSEGIEIPAASAALGACVIEKHFTLSRRLPGPDHKASLEPKELAALVAAVRKTEAALGDGVKAPRACETDVRNVARKSVVAARRIPRGAVIEEAMLAVKRPGSGIAPARLPELVGRKAARDIPRDKVISWDEVEA